MKMEQDMVILATLAAKEKCLVDPILYITGSLPISYFIYHLQSTNLACLYVLFFSAIYGIANDNYDAEMD